MSDLMREEFEVWARRKGLDLEYRNFPGVGKFYECPRTLLALESWQASRESLVIRLPDRPYASEDDQENMSDYEIGEGHGGIAEWDKCRAAIHAAGVKTK